MRKQSQRDIRRKWKSRQTQRGQKKTRIRKTDFNRQSHKWETLFRNTCNALDTYQERGNFEKNTRQVQQWLVEKGFNPKCQNQRNQ